MGRESALKSLQKQVRRVVREELPEIFQTETVSAIGKEVHKKTDEKLTMISDNVTKELKRQDEQTKTFRGMLMRDTGLQVSTELLNVTTTLLAWQELLSERLGITDKDAFLKQIEEKKTEIMKKLEEESKAREEAAAAAAAKEKEEKEKAAATAPSTESVAPAAEATP